MTEPNKKSPSESRKTSTNPIGNLVRQAQNKLESSVGSGDHNEAVLQQSRVWVKAVTWGLIGTTVFGIAWLGIARTEEVVVAHLQLVCGCDGCQCLETPQSQPGPRPPLSQVPPWSSDGDPLKTWEKEGEDGFSCHCWGEGRGQPQERCRPSHDCCLQDDQTLQTPQMSWQNHEFTG